jgi:hypothetical protein
MKGLFKLVSAVVLGSFTLSSAGLPAQDAPDSAVSLTIRLANGTSQFHVGEVIPIELSFSASAAKTFEMNTASYDRSGRLNLEGFHVTPGGRDPLYHYFIDGVNRGFTSGGLFNEVYLSQKPEVMTEDLNEWVALDQPGHYSIFVTSGRVGRSGQSFSHPMELKSNTLEFEVVEASPEWQQRALAATVSALDRAASTKEEKGAALRTLRFLDSPESVRELARRIAQPGSECNWDCTAGLFGSGHQNLVLQELESLFVAPDTAITWDYLSLLSQTRFMLEHGPMPAAPNSEEQEKLDKERQEQFDALQTALLVKATSLLPTKVGVARAQTVRTLLGYSNRGGLRQASLRDSDLEDALLALPTEEQSDLLQYSWSSIKTPGIVGVLEKILAEPKLDHHLLRGLALRRLDELDHEQAVTILLQEIRQPHPDLGVYNNLKALLEILPDTPDPRFDALLVNRLGQDEDYEVNMDTELIARLASPAPLSVVKAFYEKLDHDSCSVRGDLVSYFLRVDPEYGMRHLKDDSVFCMRAAWEAAFRVKRWKDVEPFLIAELNGPNLWNAREAAETLARFGGPNAKRAMLQRLRRFHQQWVKRQKEFKSTPGIPKVVNEAMDFQYGLVEAIGKAQGWLLEASEIAEVRRLTLGNLKEQVADWEAPHQETVGIDLSGFSFNQFWIEVDRYPVLDVASLRAKLEQFPEGTHFVIFHFGSAQQDRRWGQIIETIHETAQEHGFKAEMGVSW